jgi:hypothetical protein
MTPPPTVTVPVSDLEYVRDLLMERVHGSPARSPGHNARLTIESMLSAAPQPAAPSSLAGGEGREKVARIVDPETFALIAHYTGIERFDRLSPAERESAVFKAYPDLKAARDEAFADADAILAALSPEAPAREVSYQDLLDADVSERTIENKTGEGWSLKDIAEEHCPELLADAVPNPADIRAALTPRHEAPAEGAGEWFTNDVVEVEYRDGNGETHMFPNEVEWAEVVRWRPQPDSARSSAPEAREGEVVAGAALAKAMWGIDLKPAAPSADKLRVAREALEHYRCSCEAGHCAMSDDDTDTPVDDQLCGRRASKALSALQAEQKGGA